MSNFGSLGVSGSALRTFRTWMDAVGDNIANINTVKRPNEAAFQARYVVATAQEGGPSGMGSGVAVTGIELGDPAGQLMSDPGNPLADADGMVRRPDVDLGDQMTQLMVA